MPKRISPSELIDTIRLNRLSFSQFEGRLIKADGASYRLEGLRGARFTAYAVKKAREYLFPQIERAYTRAALKGQKSSESWLARHGFVGRKRKSFFAKLAEKTPSGHSLHPHSGVRRSAETGQFEPAPVQSYPHYVPVRGRGWQSAEVAGDDLLKLQMYRDSYDYAVGLRESPPSMRIEQFKDLDIRDIHGSKIRLETDAEKLRADWRRKTSAQRRDEYKKRHYLLRQRHSVVTRQPRPRKRGERRASGR